MHAVMIVSRYVLGVIVPVFETGPHTLILTSTVYITQACFKLVAILLPPQVLGLQAGSLGLAHILNLCK